MIRGLLDRFLRKEEAAPPEPLPTPEGHTTVILTMHYGAKHQRTFRGSPGVTSEQNARAYINGSVTFFDIGGGKFLNAQDIRDITLQ